MSEIHFISPSTFLFTLAKVYLIFVYGSIFNKTEKEGIKIIGAPFGLKDHLIYNLSRVLLLLLIVRQWLLSVTPSRQYTADNVWRKCLSTAFCAAVLD
jgi:GT2 family glycosyltransferase